MNSSSLILDKEIDKETMNIPFLLVKIEILIRHISKYADMLVDEIIKANPITATTSDAKKDIATDLRKKTTGDKGYLFIKKLNGLNTAELIKENISELMTGWAKNLKNNSNSKRLFYGKPNPLVRIDLIEQDNSNIHLGFEDYPREIDSQFLKLTELAINLSKIRDWLIHFAKRIENETDLLLTEVYNQIDLEDGKLPQHVQDFFGKVTEFSDHFLNEFKFELSKFPTVNFDSFESFDEECLELQEWSEHCVSILEKEVNLAVDEKLKKLQKEKDEILKPKEKDSKSIEAEKQEVSKQGVPILGNEVNLAVDENLKKLQEEKKDVLESKKEDSKSTEINEQEAHKKICSAPALIEKTKDVTPKSEIIPTSAETIPQNKLKYKLGMLPQSQYEEKTPTKSGPNFFQRNKKEFAVGAVVVTALIAVNAIPIIGQIASAVGWIVFGAVLLGSGLLGGATTAAVCDVQVEKPVIKRTQGAPMVTRCPATPTTQNQNIKKVPIRKESSDYVHLFRSRSGSNPTHRSSSRRLGA